jgi:hypothetical protein
VDTTLGASVADRTHDLGEDDRSDGPESDEVDAEASAPAALPTSSARPAARGSANPRPRQQRGKRRRR